MTNKPKSKGTSYESMCVRYLRRELGDERIERRALGGVNDKGDILIPSAHGWTGIVEAKCYKTYSKCHLDKWKLQTIAERENAGADFALLIAHEPGCGEKSFGQNSCYMQLRDLEKVTGGKVFAGESAKDMWVRVPVSDLVRMIRGEFGGNSDGREEA